MYNIKEYLINIYYRLPINAAAVAMREDWATSEKRASDNTPLDRTLRQEYSEASDRFNG